jgi:hypothetical protein
MLSIVSMVTVTACCFADIIFYHQILGSGPCLSFIGQQNCSLGTAVYCSNHAIPPGTPIGAECGTYNSPMGITFDNVRWANSGYDFACAGGPWDERCNTDGKCYVELVDGVPECVSGSGIAHFYQVVSVNTDCPCYP